MSVSADEAVAAMQRLDRLIEELAMMRAHFHAPEPPAIPAHAVVAHLHTAAPVEQSRRKRSATDR
jgi:hypothetical protein